MKKKDVQIGEVYSARVSGRSAAVRIDRAKPRGGWDGTNMKTRKAVRIKSAQRLRGKAVTWPGKKMGPKEATAIHAADQGNARLAEERKRSPDGRTASERAIAETVAAVEKGNLTKGVTVPTAKVKKPTPPGLGRPAGRRGGPAGKKATRAKPGGKDRKLGGLDAAARVLAEVGLHRPMKADEIVKVALAKGYWRTAGKTPGATIYAAMIREIATKGDQARFRRATVRESRDGKRVVGRGYFELSPAAAKRTSSPPKSKK